MNRLTKTLGLGSCALTLLAASWAFAQNQNSTDARIETDDPTLQVTLGATPRRAYTRKNALLRVTFGAVGKSVRLLRLFKPTRQFFDVSIEDIAGKPVINAEVAGAVKDDLPAPDALKYLDLDNGETFGMLIDIGEFLPNDLKEGSYRISLTYHNEYGKNCFKGVRKAMSIPIVIFDEPVANVIGSISEQKAIDVARHAALEKVKITANSEVTVRNTAKQFIVTFFERIPDDPPGRHYNIQVHVNRITGVVEDVLLGF